MFDVRGFVVYIYTETEDLYDTSIEIVEDFSGRVGESAPLQNVAFAGLSDDDSYSAFEDDAPEFWNFGSPQDVEILVAKDETLKRIRILMRFVYVAHGMGRE